MPGSLVLIPCPIAEGNYETLSPEIDSWVNRIDHYVVENGKTARRFLKPLLQNKTLQDLEYFEWDKHASKQDFGEALDWLSSGKDVGIVSEAGCPAVADPGSDLVRIAHKKDIRVIPLVGPSSILLALMASGMNGQQFTFHGYLSNKKPELLDDLQRIESATWKTGYAQIFMETPYRNDKMMQVLLSALRKETRLCVAVDISSSNEQIESRSISEWKRAGQRNFHKRPAIYIIARP
jgi:16S rRNA (cytidine1402-2'-O)-methyltransferase